MQYEVDIPQPQRKTVIPRSDETDNSRTAIVDALCIKHGLTFKLRRGTVRFQHPAHHGTRSFTFFVNSKSGVRVS